ncbi:MAG: hypothetical protein ACRDRR_21220 [Pseudonocardiaceae bacterium]
MNSPLVLKSAAYRQFTEPGRPFFLVTDDELTARFVVSAQASRPETTIMSCAPGDDLADIVGTLPGDADVLVVRPGVFVTSPGVGSLGGRQVAVMPCGSTPMTTRQVGYFLDVLERTDPIEQGTRADRFFDAIGTAGNLQLADPGHGTACEFDPQRADYLWNQQAGPLGPGDQQIAPAGELSVLPMEITEFDTSRRLGLNGALTLRGWPIVHGGYEPALAHEQARLFEDLLPLRQHAVVLTVDDGWIVGCAPAASTPQARAVTAVLDELLDSDPRYRAVWELGFGINTTMRVQAGNCGCNEVYGGRNGVVHFGLGLTPYTRFALTFLCPQTTLTDDAGSVLIGDQDRSDRSNGRARRIKRTRSASCGCH